MEHLIQLLPDHIANQIAAGEVVQRPASAVKELLENAVDAGASRIDLIIKDAGKALIQVIDNGCGMSSQDARMAFERHATSKIRTSDDLFNIRTMGFRGEAMASIAAVAQVEMKTRLHDQELGTLLRIEGSEVKAHEPTMTAKGTCTSVKNLFFNVPARRNFLKTNPVETRHILNEFMRVALAQPEIAMSLDHNGVNIYQLPPGELDRRITDLLGKDLEDKLIAIGEDTPYIRIGGFLGAPEAARKKRGDQYFFVNRRFIKSGYLHHAIQTAFSGLIPDDTHPFYCIFFEIDPAHVDINIHPTKTEIKFDDERTVYQLLHSVVRKGLGEYHQVSLDREEDSAGLLQLLGRDRLQEPDREATIGMDRPRTSPRNWGSDWDNVFPVQEAAADRKDHRETPLFPDYQPPQSRPSFEKPQVETPEVLFQLGGRYIVTQAQDGLLLVDQCHAHQRILFERFMVADRKHPLPSQQMLFPHTLEFSPADFQFLREIEDEVREMGFDLREFGANTYILHGVPASLKGSKAEQFFEQIISEVRETGGANLKEKVHERLAKAIALRTAMQAGKKLNGEEMRNIVDELFQSEQPGFSPAGKPTYKRLTIGELERYFQGKF